MSGFEGLYRWESTSSSPHSSMPNERKNLLKQLLCWKVFLNTVLLGNNLMDIPTKQTQITLPASSCKLCIAVVLLHWVPPHPLIGVDDPQPWDNAASPSQCTAPPLLDWAIASSFSEYCYSPENLHENCQRHLSLGGRCPREVKPLVAAPAWWIEPCVGAFSIDGRQRQEDMAGIGRAGQGSPDMLLPASDG